MRPLFAARQRNRKIEECLTLPGFSAYYYPESDVIFVENDAGDEVQEDVTNHTHPDDPDELLSPRRAVGKQAYRTSSIA